MQKIKIVPFHTYHYHLILKTNTYTVGSILRLRQKIHRKNKLFTELSYLPMHNFARCDKKGTLPNLLTGGSFYQNLSKYDQKWSKFDMK